MSRILDVRTRCARCKQIPRGKLAKQSYERYRPFCSYHCQEWAQLEDAARYAAALSRSLKQEIER